jgi:hypothetical protein
MEEDEFFVMLNHPNCSPLVMTDKDGDGDDIAYFDTKESAEASAKNNTLGHNYGYEVFQLGRGE